MLGLVNRYRIKQKLHNLFLSNDVQHESEKKKFSKTLDKTISFLIVNPTKRQTIKRKLHITKIFTSKGRLHRGLSQRVQQLRTFIILRKRRSESSEGICMSSQALQGHSLPIIGLETTTLRKTYCRNKLNLQYGKHFYELKELNRYSCYFLLSALQASVKQ